MYKLNTSVITLWNIATKTKSIKAKPLASILADKLILSKFLLDTLEGTQALNKDSMVCLGVAGDVWQQTQNKLLSKYTVQEITNDGWLVCNPIPDNEVEVIEVTTDTLIEFGCKVQPEEINDFCIIGQWGVYIEGIGKNIQTGVIGDFVCRNVIDKTDNWIVKRNIFLNTYTLK